MVYTRVLDISGFPQGSKISEVESFIRLLTQSTCQVIESEKAGHFLVILNTTLEALTLWRALEYCPFQNVFLQVNLMVKPVQKLD